MEPFYTKYKDSKTSIIETHTYMGNTYYVIQSVEEKIFQDDTLEEEKVYLVAGVKRILFNTIYQKYPKMVSMEISGLLHNKYWEAKHYFHHMAHVRTDSVKPIFKQKNVTPSNTSKSHTDFNSIMKNFTIKQSDLHKMMRVKISQLEAKTKKYPSNFTILYTLRDPYKELGDTEGYANTNERIMTIKMDI